MKALEMLKAARETLSNKACWIKYQYACDKEGNSVSSRDPGAVKFCMVGALTRQSTTNPLSTEYHKAEDAIYDALPIRNITIVEFNDEHATHQEVLAVFDKVIKSLEQGTPQRE